MALADGLGRPRSASHGAKHLPEARAAFEGLRGWVADFGCGEGIFTEAAPGYVGLDLDPASATRVRSAGKPSIVADVRRAPLRDASCDGVLLVNTLHAVGDPVRVLDEVDRVLKPGGRVYLKNRWHKGGGEPQGAGGRLARRLHLHHLRFWNHAWAHSDGSIHTSPNPNGTTALCPRCVRRRLRILRYSLQVIDNQVFVATKSGGGQASRRR